MAEQLRDTSSEDGCSSTMCGRVDDPDSGGSGAPASASRAGTGLVARDPGSQGFGILLIGLAAVGMVGLGYYVAAYRPDVVEGIIAYDPFVPAPVPTGLDIEVKPVSAAIFVDGEPQGNGRPTRAGS